jgi:pimeloyl-ACP methyl ester carboxylesterase
MHPRLFHSLIFMEPVIRGTLPPGPNAASMATNKPDLWSSREVAESEIRRSKFYKSWDQRALDKYLEYGLRQTPTLLYPDAPAGSVTLSTTKQQEAWTYLRSMFTPRPAEGQLDERERLTTSDMSAELAQYQFHRAECFIALQSLSSLQPSVTWIFGSKSWASGRSEKEDIFARTGSSARGSGGVQSIVIDGANHMLPLEKVNETAELVSAQIKTGLDKYQKEVDFWKTYDSGKSIQGGLHFSEKWKRAVRQKADTKRPLATTPKL